MNGLCLWFIFMKVPYLVLSQPTVPSNWWQYPFPYNIIKLYESQVKLQSQNIVDSYTENNDKRLRCSDPKIGKGPYNSRCRKSKNKMRRLDGQCNDYDTPSAGSLLYRFGRNMPLETTPDNYCNLYTPNPRSISRSLLQRKEFIPAKTINLLVAGWIQFMTHDWFDSGPNDRSRRFQVHVDDDDPDFSNSIKIPMTRPDSCTNIPGLTKMMCQKLPPTLKICKNVKEYETYQNTVTHWWDASQLYGTDRKTNRRVRTGRGGKLVLNNGGRLPLDSSTGLPITGKNNNWWVGLELFHIIWTKEHNFICDQLEEQNPSWTDNKLFETARLIVSAVIAKIHTLEWTTAILQNDLVKMGLKSNWYGISMLDIAKGDRSLADSLSQQFPPLANGVPGAVGKPKNIRGVPFSLTQDFIAVYKLHPLLPDYIEVKDKDDGAVLNRYNMADVVFEKTDKVFQENSIEDIIHSFGNANPGAMALHNYPNFLRHLNLPRHSPHGEGYVDLAVIDLMRERERGIPRYNEFRRQLHLTPLSSFDDLTPNTEHVEELRKIYNDDIELLDLLVGSLAESPLPEGFGFSDTFNRIFVVMARRRLEADRFFTDDYTQEFYTQWGLDYVDKTYMKEILLRHYPTLACNLHTNVTNVFIPWINQNVRDESFPFPIYE